MGTCESPLSPSGWGQGASPKWPRRLVESWGGGKFFPRGCPRTHGECSSVLLGPRVDSSELALHDATLSLLWRRASGPEASADFTGLFLGCISIVTEDSFCLGFAQMKEFRRQRKPPRQKAISLAARLPAVEAAGSGKARSGERLLIAASLDFGFERLWFGR